MSGSIELDGEEYSDLVATVAALTKRLETAEREHAETKRVTLENVKNLGRAYAERLAALEVVAKAAQAAIDAHSLPELIAALDGIVRALQPRDTEAPADKGIGELGCVCDQITEDGGPECPVHGPLPLDPVAQAVAERTRACAWKLCGHCRTGYEIYNLDQPEPWHLINGEMWPCKAGELRRAYPECFGEREEDGKG